MFSTLKGYLYAAGGLVVAVFAAMFAYRGHKIEKQEAQIEASKEDQAWLESGLNMQKETVKQVEKANEILTERSNAYESAERLRQRAKNRQGN